MKMHQSLNYIFIDVFDDKLQLYKLTTNHRLRNYLTVRYYNIIIRLCLCLNKKKKIV